MGLLRGGRAAAPARADLLAERRYIRAAEETIVSAEKIINRLKPRIAAAKRSLGISESRAKRKVKRKTAKAAAKRATLKKKAARSRKKKL